MVGGVYPVKLSRDGRFYFKRTWKPLIADEQKLRELAKLKYHAVLGTVIMTKDGKLFEVRKHRTSELDYVFFEVREVRE